MNQEKEKSFEEAQLSERFERKTFESESFLIKKNKSKESVIHTDLNNTYKPRFKPKTLTVSFSQVINLFKFFSLIYFLFGPNRKIVNPSFFRQSLRLLVIRTERI